MSQQVNTTVIGGFVITAIALIITAFALFGGGAFWKHTELYVLHFEESIKGLTTGSPVMFRGVQIGTVKSITLQTGNEQSTVNIPTIIEINGDKFQYRDKPLKNFKYYFAEMIENGLRAQLAMQSIVTGQLMVQLDFHPDREIRVSGIESKHVEIPTIRSSLGELGIALEELPLQEIIANIKEISNQITKILAAGEIDKFLTSMSSAADDTSTLIKDTRKLVINIDDKLNTLSLELDESLENATTLLTGAMESITMTADNANEMLSTVEQEIVPLAGKLNLTLDSATEALEHAGTTMQVAGDFIEQSDTRIKLNRTLDEISAAARSIRELSDYLERHPEALLMGKDGGKN